jgi:hypothetical protein
MLCTRCPAARQRVSALPCLRSNLSSGWWPSLLSEWWLACWAQMLAHVEASVARIPGLRAAYRMDALRRRLDTAQVSTPTSPSAPLPGGQGGGGDAGRPYDGLGCSLCVSGRLRVRRRLRRRRRGARRSSWASRWATTPWGGCSTGCRRRRRPPWRRASTSQVSHSCACNGSPCLRHCVHGAPIGGERELGAAAAEPGVPDVHALPLPPPAAAGGGSPGGAVHGQEAVGPSGAGRGGVSRAFPSGNRSILTEIYLCHACYYDHDIEDGDAWAERRLGWASRQPREADG